MKIIFKHPLILLLTFTLLTGCGGSDDDSNNNLSGDKEIISFSIPGDIEGTVNHSEQTVSVLIPFDIDITSIEPDITVSEGATYTPVGAQDFSSLVVYTVIAEDGTEAEYIVTIELDITLQRAALVDFYNANGGATNNAFDTWDVEDDESDIADWDGVSVNTEGFVVSLVLVEKHISTIPESFTDLTELNFLNLSINDFDEFPEVIISLENLTQLYMGLNELQSLPDTIDNLVMLEELNLYGCSLTNLPSTIVNLTNLTYINIEANTLTLSTDQCNFITSIDDYTIDPGVCD